MTNPQKVIKVVTPAKADVRKRPARQGGADVKKKLGSGPKAAPPPALGKIVGASQPTRMDALKAEVVAAEYANPSCIAYTYAWKVNNRIVEGATGDTLNLSTFRRGTSSP